MMDVVTLTQQLVSMPSYFDEHTDERRVAEYIAKVLNIIGSLQVTLQRVEGDRVNVIAHDGHPARLIFCCHMDTVQPSGTWTHDPFAGEIVGDHLFGLGAADMKGGLACVLDAVASAGETQGLWLLFDVDEEYEFKGMSRFLEEYAARPDLRPMLAVFPEPGTDIENGHRGVLELHLRVHGESGHAARPGEGKNAILAATRAVEQLLKQMSRYSDPVLGRSSCNLASLRGGIQRGTDAMGDPIIVSTNPNKIPDIAEMVLDIRSSSPALRAQTAIDLLEAHLAEQGCTLDVVKVTFDRPPLLIPRERLREFQSIVRSVWHRGRFADLRGSGYGEGGMFNEQIGGDCVYFGPGPDTQIHKPDEFVSITELRQVRDVFAKLIEHYCLRKGTA